MADLQRHAYFGQGRHAAVLGDNPAARNATAVLLRSWGFEVWNAVSPAELDDTPIDLLVADHDDIVTGGGIAAITAMRKRRPGLRIILLSGQPEALQQRDSGAAADVLRKPVLPIALRAAITKVMAGS
jgi:CheY-like chemotaxis protein